jgi:hypothetical protein
MFSDLPLAPELQMKFKMYQDKVLVVLDKLVIAKIVGNVVNSDTLARTVKILNIGKMFRETR